MSFKMTFNGKPFDSNAFAKELEKEVVNAVKRKLPEVIAEKLQDPKTGEKPQVSINGNTVEKLSDLNGMKATIVGSDDLLSSISDTLTTAEK